MKMSVGSNIFMVEKLNCKEFYRSISYFGRY